MKNLSQKIVELQYKKEALEQELLEVKRRAVKDLAAALVQIQNIESVDIYTIIGAVLESLKNNQKKENLQKAGRMFFKKHKHQISLLSEK